MCFFNNNSEFHEDFFPKITKIEIWKVFGLNLNDCQADMDMNILKLKKNFAMNCSQLLMYLNKIIRKVVKIKTIIIRLKNW